MTLHEYDIKALDRIVLERGMTWADVCGLADIALFTVHRWLRGESRPSPEKVKAITDALGLDLADFVVERAPSPDSARDGNAQSSVRDRTLPTSAPGAGADSPAGGPLTVPPQAADSSAGA